jgi:sRNA-binding carbon storage regulator CsrA
MKQYSRVDNEGFYIEPILLNEDEIPNDPLLISTPVPEGFYLPKWNGTAWEEGKPLEEIEAHIAQQEIYEKIKEYKKTLSDTNIFSFIKSELGIEIPTDIKAMRKEALEYIRNHNNANPNSNK